MSSTETEAITMDNSTQTELSTKSKIQCSICNKTYAGKNSLYHHQHRYHSDKMLVSSRREKKEKINSPHANERNTTLKETEIYEQLVRISKVQDQHTELMKHIIRLLILNDIEEV